jgi:hypothetical protein
MFNNSYHQREQLITLVEEIKNLLIAQGVQSKDHSDPFSGCMYRAVVNNCTVKCAAGHKISDEAYTPDLENKTVDLKMVQDALVQSGVPHWQLPVIYQCQVIHDYIEPEHWRGAFEALIAQIKYGHENIIFKLKDDVFQPDLKTIHTLAPGAQDPDYNSED